MPKLKRRRFFIKDNFRINFIIGFTLFLFIEIITEYFFIYRQSRQAIEETIFKSHINIDTGAQIIWPIITKINIFGILTAIFIAAITLSVIYLRMHILFKKVISGLDKLKNNDASFRIGLYGKKDTRGIIKEFNQAASCLEKQLDELDQTLDSLIIEKELKQIQKIHDKLYSLIANKVRE